uniref:Uncharacterized protein LOC114347308 n=1 Tax=Diabrotica virgifera virgifera TaxID=50390 RepID=A0A6P7H804_DIAVI
MTNVSDLKENDGEEVEDCEQITEKVDNDFRPPPAKVANKRVSAQKQLIAVAQKLAEVPAVAPPNKWESFGLSVAGDLQMLTDIRQQAIAQKIISDAIFWAKMRRLTEESRVSLAPSTASTPTTSASTTCPHRIPQEVI